MKVCIVSCFEWYEKRLKYVEKYFKEQNFEVVYITSDFEHIKKEYVKPVHGVDYIHTLSYKKNLSIRRLVSHFLFARAALKKWKELQPDYLYVLVPPNSMVKRAARYRTKHTETKLILDVIDMWPESMPIKNSKVIEPVFSKWAGLRDNYVKAADLVFTECNLFQEILKTKVSREKLQTLYLVKEEGDKETVKRRGQGFSICYLGSINNIIDVDFIVAFLELLSGYKKVEFYLIGKGEQKKYLVDRLKQLPLTLHDEGAVYEESLKNSILKKCDFGLNIMKKEVYVGLTIKSIDYLSVGLPLINNIGGDTERFVKEYNVGYNISNSNMKEMVKILSCISSEELEKMHKNAYCLYEEKFSPKAFEKILKKRMKRI